MTKGYFISIEGVDGAGKSTQLKRIVEKFKSLDLDFIQTREPGGCPVAEEIRTLLLTGDTDKFDPKSEAMLFYTARNEHLRQTILPALSKGKIVLSDRFADSTMAFQHYGHGYDRNFIELLHKQVVGENNPNLTLIFDMDPEIALKRSLARLNESSLFPEKIEDRMEKVGLEFQQRIRKGLHEIANNDPERCVIIDADAAEDEVFARVWSAISKRLNIQE